VSVKKPGYEGRTPVTTVLGIVTAVLSLLTWYLFFGSGVTSVFNRTESAKTVTVSAETLMDGATIYYSFYDRGGVLRSGVVWASGPVHVIQAAKAERSIVVWYEPDNPNNLGVEIPNFWLQPIWFIVGWGLTGTWIAIYIRFLEDSWGLWPFKKTAQRSQAELVAHMLEQIRHIRNVHDRVGALKGSWDSAETEVRLEICHQLNIQPEVALSIVGREFVLGGDPGFDAVIAAL
jgi:hypothetical protein